MSSSLNIMVAVTVLRILPLSHWCRTLRAFSSHHYEQFHLPKANVPQNCNEGQAVKESYISGLHAHWDDMSWQHILICNWTVRKATKALVFITSGILLLKVPVGHTQLGL